MEGRIILHRIIHRKKQNKQKFLKQKISGYQKPRRGVLLQASLNLSTFVEPHQRWEKALKVASPPGYCLCLFSCLLFSYPASVRFPPLYPPFHPSDRVSLAPGSCSFFCLEGHLHSQLFCSSSLSGHPPRSLWFPTWASQIPCSYHWAAVVTLLHDDPLWVCLSLDYESSDHMFALFSFVCPAPYTTLAKAM